MKTIFAILLVASSEAFVPTNHVRFGVPSTALFAESADDAIKAALLASKTHGPTSKEARCVSNPFVSNPFNNMKRSKNSESNRIRTSRYVRTFIRT